MLIQASVVAEDRQCNRDRHRDRQPEAQSVEQTVADQAHHIADGSLRLRRRRHAGQGGHFMRNGILLQVGEFIREREVRREILEQIGEQPLDDERPDNAERDALFGVLSLCSQCGTALKADQDQDSDGRLTQHRRQRVRQNNGGP